MPARPPEKPPSVAGLFVPTMHGLRGWAILILFVYHVAVATRYVPHGEVPKAFLQGGFLALDVLFFTTGFVLFLPVVQAGRFGSVRAFAVRRLARMAPPYYVCLLVILVAYPVLTTDAMAAAADNSVGAYLTHFAFLQREVLVDDGGLGVNGPLWALSIDFVFYLVLPLVAGAYLRRPLVGLALGTAVAAAWRLSIDEVASGTDLLVQFPLFVGDLAAGMTAAWALLRLKRDDAPAAAPWVPVAAAAAAFVGLVGLLWWAGSRAPGVGALWVGADAPMVAFPLVLGVFAVALGLAPRAAQWPLANRAIMWFSEISYSFFLYHVMIMVFALVTLRVNPNGSPAAVLKMTAFALPVTAALAFLSYRYVELPSRRHGRALARRVGKGHAVEAGAASARARALGSAPDRA